MITSASQRVRKEREQSLQTRRSTFALFPTHPPPPPAPHPLSAYSGGGQNKVDNLRNQYAALGAFTNFRLKSEGCWRPNPRPGERGLGWGAEISTGLLFADTTKLVACLQTV